jgi:hypothetical protein
MPVTLAQLKSLTAKAVIAAGPRYTPGIEPGAPNINIGYLDDVIQALALSEGFRERLRESGREIARAFDSCRYIISPHFRGRVRTPQALSAQIDRTIKADGLEAIIAEGGKLRVITRSVARRVEKSIDELWERQRQISEKDDQRRRALDTDIHQLRTLSDAVEGLESYLHGISGTALLRNNTLLLLGAWGTGKTHFLCDVAQNILGAGRPALLVLASSLPKDTDPLEAVALECGLRPSTDALLEGLSSLARKNKSRALLLVDAINEGDRTVWNRRVAHIARKVKSYPDVGLVISCRRPFENLIFTDRSLTLFTTAEHFGFDEQELDAQLEFFRFYGLSAPQMPFLSFEFSRPLFLKLLCKALKDLSKRSQKAKLREIASGQKGMTYILEYLTKHVGKSIEQDFGLSGSTCWRILKGGTSGGHPGIAGTMAAHTREWVTRDEAESAIKDECACGDKDARDILDRLILEGILSEELIWEVDVHELVIHFPYQRFGDHLVSRHLLEQHLTETTDESRLRRIFYSNRPLGKFFVLDQWDRGFRFPGIVAAIMLEFPERMKRSPLEKELIHYLPRRCRRVSALKEVFLDGLYWRSTDSFGPLTHNVVNFLLSDAGDQIRNETLEVLSALAARAPHPYNATRLTDYLKKFNMADRDLLWSEFLRHLDEHGALLRLLSWIELNPAASAREEDVVNQLRLISLILTTSNRRLRDRATHSLVMLGLKYPAALFAQVLEGLEFPDPYVPERMLAAAYGVCMRSWANPKRFDLRQELPEFARQLVRRMFLQDAPSATRHILARDYALGVIAIARRISPRCIAPKHVRYIRGTFDQIPSPFRSTRHIRKMTTEQVKRALRMDFENYTLGRLVSDRENYQENHADYQAIKKQVMQRMFDLGYTSAKFEDVDRRIARSQPYGRPNDAGKIDRYGKKYSWVAFFEMYGALLDAGRLAEHRILDRTSDCDIDPSFPATKRKWKVEVPKVFWRAPRLPVRWLRNGPSPTFQNLLALDIVDDQPGPWLLLDGFVRLKGTHAREVWTFLRALLVQGHVIEQLRTRIEQTDYLGNHKIPEAAEDYYTFAGEVPWSHRFGSVLRRKDGSAKGHHENAIEWYSPGRTPYPVEVPVHYWAWESYHSEMNNVSGVKFPAPALTEYCGLQSRDASFDLYDSTGRIATLYRDLDGMESGSHVLYMRADLVQQYLTATNQQLVWIPWGERNLHHDVVERRLERGVQKARMEHANNFSDFVLCTPESRL